MSKREEFVESVRSLVFCLDAKGTWERVLALWDEMEAALKQRDKDAERFKWWFGDEDKINFFSSYYIGMREHWTIDQWRAGIDTFRQEQPVDNSPAGEDKED